MATAAKRAAVVSRRAPAFTNSSQRSLTDALLDNAGGYDPSTPDCSARRGKGPPLIAGLDSSSGRGATARAV